MSKKKSFTAPDEAIGAFFSRPEPPVKPASNLRNRRVNLLLNEQLKEDLTILSKGAKSLNDLIVTVLAKYVEENQSKLSHYKSILK